MLRRGRGGDTEQLGQPALIVPMSTIDEIEPALGEFADRHTRAVERQVAGKRQLTAAAVGRRASHIGLDLIDPPADAGGNLLAIDRDMGGIAKLHTDRSSRPRRSTNTLSGAFTMMSVMPSSASSGSSGP